MDSPDVLDSVPLIGVVMKLSLVYLPSLAIESSDTLVQMNLPVL